MTYMTETGRGKQKKEALLTDSDALWAEFRHKHIGKVLTDLGMLQRYVMAGRQFVFGSRFVTLAYCAMHT